MSTSNGSTSFRVPTPADLRDVGYSDTHADIVPPVFECFKRHGWRTLDQLAAATGFRASSILAALRNAKKRGHATDRPGDDKRDGRWNFGFEYGSIPETEAVVENPLPQKGMKTTAPILLRRFYPDVVRRFRKTHSTRYADTLDWVARKILDWRPEITVEQITPDTLNDFDLHLKSLGMVDETRRGILRHARAILREKYPYRWLLPKTQWKVAEPYLRTEPAGCLGNYYVTVFEPRHQSATRRDFRREGIKRFLRWCGEPVKLSSIDDELLRKFIKSDVDDQTPPNRIRELALQIRRVVNDWKPGQLRPLRQPIPPSTDAGTVQHFVESIYIPSKQKPALTDERIRQIRRVTRLLHTYNKSRGLKFLDFTDDLCADFLRWCLSHTDRGKQLTSDTVNIRLRYELVGISKAAAAKGLMKRRLYLEPVAPFTRRRSTAGPKGVPPNDSKTVKTKSVTLPANNKPQWDAKRGQLWIGGQCRKVAKQAKHLRPVLDLFEKAGWPSVVDSPFRDPKQHENVIAKLNTHQTAARFFSTQQGTAIGWEILDEKRERRVERREVSAKRS